MKGFAKIFEAVIASVILLASLTFFFVPNVHESGWDKASLQALSQDVLQSAYFNGTLARYVKEDNATQLNTLISSMLPKTVDFSLEVKGIPNKIIYISCVDCDQTQLDNLSAILAPEDFSYKRQNISVRIENLSLASSSIPEGTNILFFFDKAKISAYENQTSAFMAGGGNVFLLSDLTQNDLNGRIGSLFNLTWTGTTALPGRFDDIYNSSKTSHFFARYYANISTRHLQNVEGETFTAFHQSGIKAESDWRNIAKADDGRAYVRSNINGTGRAVWLSDYTRTDHNAPATKAIDNLTKSAVMWASGERFKLDLIKKSPAPVHFKSTIFVYDEDTYAVELTIWRIFF